MTEVCRNKILLTNRHNLGTDTRKENKFIRVNLCLKDRNKGTLHAFRRRPIILFHVISGN